MEYNPIDLIPLCTWKQEIALNEGKSDDTIDEEMQSLMGRMFPEQQRQRSSLSGNHDWYSAIASRSIAGVKEGLCGYCLKWFVMRTNHYRYHMQSAHGIDSATKAPFPRPLILRYDLHGVIFGWCAVCQNWVKLQSAVVEKRERLAGIDMNRKCWHLHMMNVHGKWGRRWR